MSTRVARADSPWKAKHGDRLDLEAATVRLDLGDGEPANVRWPCSYRRSSPLR